MIVVPRFDRPAQVSLDSRAWYQVSSAFTCLTNADEIKDRITRPFDAGESFCLPQYRRPSSSVIASRSDVYAQMCCGWFSDDCSIHRYTCTVFWDCNIPNPGVTHLIPTVISPHLILILCTYMTFWSLYRTNNGHLQTCTNTTSPRATRVKLHSPTAHILRIVYDMPKQENGYLHELSTRGYKTLGIVVSCYTTYIPY